MLGPPAHGGGDSGTPAGMIEKDELLNWTGVKLAIFSQQHIHIRFSIGLLGCIQAVHVRLIFQGA